MESDPDAVDERLHKPTHYPFAQEATYSRDVEPLGGHEDDDGLEDLIELIKLETSEDPNMEGFARYMTGGYHSVDIGDRLDNNRFLVIG